MVMYQVSGQEAMSFSLWTLYFLLGLFTIYFTGLLDDLAGLRARTKLFIQLLAAVVLPLSGL
jgi:UDP-N-acetylmuramyl pentapeptide phosphotransferase/UDP-N-acetylglucosamine-1-phosphate transferase